MADNQGPSSDELCIFASEAGAADAKANKPSQELVVPVEFRQCYKTAYYAKPMNIGNLPGRPPSSAVPVPPSVSVTPTPNISVAPPKLPPTKPPTTGDLSTPPIPTQSGKKPLDTNTVLFLLGGAILALYAFWPRKMKVNKKKRSDDELWDELWENHIASLRSGDKTRILYTAEMLEEFDRQRGWSPTVTVRSIKKKFGW